MKYYHLRDTDFDNLLQIMELHKYKGSNGLNTNLAIEVGKVSQEIKTGKLPHELSPDRITDILMTRLLDDMHRSFHYHVYGWVQEMKK